MQNCLQNKWILPRLHVQDQAIILYEWGGYNIIQDQGRSLEILALHNSVAWAQQIWIVQKLVVSPPLGSICETHMIPL